MSLRNCILFTVVVLLTAVSAFGQMKTFSGPSGGNWHHPANWTPPGVPTAADNVLIDVGQNIDVGGAGVEAANLWNNGEINNPGDINVGGFFANEGHGVINGVENINAGDFDNEGHINGVANIAVGGDFSNDGHIIGFADVPLNININVNDMAVGIAAENEEHGNILGFNININVRNGDFLNQGHIEAMEALILVAFEIHVMRFGRFQGQNVQIAARKDFFNNEGEIVSTGGTSPFGMGNNIEIVAFNKFGTGQFINSGTVQGGDGDPGNGGDNIDIKTDNFENSGDIRPGENGSGTGVYGGNATINGRVVLFFAGGGVVAYEDEDGTTNVLLISDIIHMWSTYGGGSRSSEDAMLRANSINVVGRQIILEDLPDSTIIATDYIELISINLPGNVIDLSGVENERVIVANPTGEILIRGDNLIAPPIGYNAMCEPDPTVMGGSIAVSNVSIFGEPVMSFTGHSDSLEVLIRNEHSVARTFNYTVNSRLGWFTPVSGTTPTLDPWETHSFYVHFSIPSGFTETTYDTVTSAITGLLWPITFKSNIIAFPFDTLHYLPVAERRVEMPEAMSISAHPNPFNSAVKITLDGVGAIHELPLQVEIFDVNGRRVSIIPAKAGIQPPQQSAGFPIGVGNDIEYIWSPEETLPSGVYLVRASIDGVPTATKRLVYLK